MSPRHALDAYSTPAHYVEPLLALIGPLTGLRVYEPCVGLGDIARYLADAKLVTNDIDPACPATTHHDARDLAAWPHTNTMILDWVVSNPPFSDALPILQLALASSRNVAFLARLSFLEPTIERGPFWLMHPPTDLIVLPRYSFRRDDQGKRQTDNVTCCWLVWRHGRAPCVSFSLWRPAATRVAEAAPLSAAEQCDAECHCGFPHTGTAE